MTGNAKHPDDKGFIHALIVMVQAGQLAQLFERIVFIDTDDQVREAVYPQEFPEGKHLRARKELTEAGVLKGVIYDGIQELYPSAHRGRRLLVVEYIPTGEIFELMYTPAIPRWVNPTERDRKTFQELWKE